ncbi:MAG: DNA polymerase elongation subunit (family B) [Candidatus Thermoplasmatota archaeon]|nr:DNA polymerase elongation subunit (family B) [Candidatus Thermoplasmatota archaeon]
MNDMILGISPENVYTYGNGIQEVSKFHKPYFLVFCPKEKNLEIERKQLIKKLKENESQDNILSKIDSLGEIEEYRSFWDFNRKIKIFKVYTKKSYYVPEVTDFFFLNYGLFTAEHDIPYDQRALVDLEATNFGWIYDSSGKKTTLKVLVYDIETTKFDQAAQNIPIDIIGYSTFDISFESSKSLETEEFSFDILDCPSDWEDIEIKQIMSKNVDDEIENLYNFCKILMNAHIISGHNILGFDNVQIYNRLEWILKNYKQNLSQKMLSLFKEFLNSYARIDKSFHFGIRSQIVQFYPSSLDTYLGARKFYSFLDDFSLKAVAPFLGIKIKNRIILTPSEIRLDDKTLKYNKQDMQEQLGVTLNLIQQSLPLAFTTGMSFDMLLSSGAVNMWDHMSMIRSAHQKKIMPPICRVMSIAQTLLHDFRDCETKEDIVKKARKDKDHLSKELLRVVKYGDEMPTWVQDPYVIYNTQSKDPEDRLNYHMPGGMTIKPDKDALSHFIPWWYVVVADVGAMYPTILKAMNIGADTVRLTRKSENADAWIWLKKLPQKFLDKRDVTWRNINKDDTYADKGYMLGVKIDKNPGVVNCSMTGIMSLIAQIKRELKIVEKSGNREELQRLKMMYQSVKGARNAGTHGILSAPGVSGRQFNLWGAATITTKGQMILADTLSFLKKEGIRVVYGDTDGIYLGCSSSVANTVGLKQSLGILSETTEGTWLTRPEVAFSAIEKCNKKWQDELNYPDFELEPETHNAMIFVKHKNYLIFDEKNGKIEMITKGNNFKGSDKADIARKVLKQIMIEVLKENATWNDEEEARNNVKASITNKTKEIVSQLDLTKVDIDDLTLIQSVQPASRYKCIQDGSDSTFAKRAKALEKLIGNPIKTRIKMKFVITKKPLPGISKPSKSGVKPIDYMYPVDLLKDKREIDLNWYKNMIENYVQGAFGLSDVKTTEQQGLDAWM